MEYVKAKTLSLKVHPVYTEKWLQQRIAEDPTLLGLGDLTLKEAERRQPHAGRLDLLLTDPETQTRYEIEIQLGATDESHIIRTIEYWDLEKTRYPQYEHVAVIVAEDITSRFLNVINLLNKTIPLIAVQIRALDVGGQLTLNATTVLDLVRRGTDEEDEPGQATDRAYWLGRGSETSLALADQVLELVQHVAPGMTLKYNKHYIGLAKDGIADNFVQLRPRREHLIAEFRIPRSDDVSAMLEDAGASVLAYDKQFGYYRLRLTSADVESYQSLLMDLLHRARGTQAVVVTA